MGGAYTDRSCHTLGSLDDATNGTRDAAHAPYGNGLRHATSLSCASVRSDARHGAHGWRAAGSFSGVSGRISAQPSSRIATKREAALHFPR